MGVSASAAEAAAEADEEDCEVRGKEEEEHGGRGPAAPARGGNGPPEIGAAKQLRRCHGASRRPATRSASLCTSARAARSPVRVGLVGFVTFLCIRNLEDTSNVKLDEAIGLHKVFYAWHSPPIYRKVIQLRMKL